MIPVLTSLVTLFGMWLVSKKDWRGWAVVGPFYGIPVVIDADRAREQRGRWAIDDG